MRTFISKEKKPICNWGSLSQNSYFEGPIPESYKLCINPSPGYIVIDVDLDIEKNKNGYKNIPFYFTEELANTYFYSTPRGGSHYWLKYTGDKTLMNSTSKLDIDLRTDKGYVCYYPANNGDDIRNNLHRIKESSLELNLWLESLFALEKE